jgi:hypothetical protein
MNMKPLSLTTALLLINCFSFFEVNAQSCYGHSTSSGECAKIIDVAVYGDVDRRRTEEEFAKEVGESFATIQKRFAATGTLTCKGSIPCPSDPKKTCIATMDGSAQLTLGTDVITTASHLLDDPKTCQIYAKADGCTFTIAGNGAPQVIKVAIRTVFQSAAAKRYRRVTSSGRRVRFGTGQQRGLPSR